jgi:hypothetical protein
LQSHSVASWARQFVVWPEKITIPADTKLAWSASVPFGSGAVPEGFNIAVELKISVPGWIKPLSKFGRKLQYVPVI